MNSLEVRVMRMRQHKLTVARIGLDFFPKTLYVFRRNLSVLQLALELALVSWATTEGRLKSTVTVCCSCVADYSRLAVNLLDRSFLFFQRARA